MKHRFLAILYTLIAFCLCLSAAHSPEANEQDLTNYLDFKWEAYEYEFSGEDNSHSFVLGTRVWQEYVDLLIDDYITITGQGPGLDWFDAEIYEDLGWLDFEEFVWWLDWFVPHVADEVLGTLAWRDWERSSLSAEHADGVLLGESHATISASNVSHAAVTPVIPAFDAKSPTTVTPDSSSSTIVPDHTAGLRSSEFGDRLCAKLPPGFNPGYPNSGEFAGYQELLYVLWWQKKGCLDLNHWQSYLNFRKTFRDAHPFLRNANGAWDSPLSIYELYMGMFDRGNYNLKGPTVGDLIEFEIFIGWMEFQEAVTPMFFNYEGKVDGQEVSFTYPVKVRKGIKGQTIGLRLLYLTTVKETTRVPEALMGLVTMLHEAPIEHLEAFKSWLNLGVIPLTRLELLEAGGITSATDLANYIDLKAQQLVEKHAPDSVIAAGLTGVLEGANDVVFRTPDQFVDNIQNFGEATGEAMYGMEGRSLIDRLAVASKDFRTVSEISLVILTRRLAKQQNPTRYFEPTKGSPNQVRSSPGTTFKTWNQFQSGTKGQFATRAEAAKAWSAYKQANGIVSGNVRSSAVKSQFLKGLAENGNAPKWMNQWLKKGKVPPGYHVDHIKPISVGGPDLPSNMRLLTIDLHKTHHRFYRPWE